MSNKKHSRTEAGKAPEMPTEEVQDTAQPDTDKEATAEIPEEDELTKLNRELNSLRDDHLRLMAEFDNYRKRTLKEKSELIRNGGERTLRDLLPVVDDMERAISNLPEEERKTPFAEGVELIYKKMTDFLTAQGVKPIETVGEVFDDEKHEAVAMIPAPNPEEAGKVIDCTRKGYTLNDKVLRFAAVVVGQ
ncbi:nucleotide exchange factor GrpE [Porphyromonas crevioricanis]|uniref:Protein GrpE n=1 Tax=Porphyromonas crevioricanis TaxID=393921 RepID=A0AB34PI90_9PORP|nr:nucleotide exchange factor GrpE [Porphyromonas crevioricanis]KGN95086.1 molecular chaperone GrpE [Porphyromonas crevioricanis]